MIFKVPFNPRHSVILRLEAWVNTLHIMSSAEAGQSTCPVLVNTTTKQLETPDIYWSKHLSCEQLTTESSKQSSSSPPCHLSQQERASLDTARV